MHGVHVPVVTPFAADGTVDAASLERLARHVLEQGAAGLVALSTTGEALVLTAEEKRAVVAICRRVSDAHHTPLTVGAGTAGTAESVRQASECAQSADFLLVPVPYYVRPSDEGVLDHFAAVGAAANVPLIAYNVPYRSGKTLHAETLLALLGGEHVVGIKHCAGSIDADTLTLLARGRSVFGGDDAFLYPLLQLGAVGGITASACVAPRAYVSMVDAVSDGAAEHARSRHEALLPLATALFAEPSPAVIKAVLAERGLIEHATVRAPLRAAGATSVAAALDVLKVLET